MIYWKLVKFYFISDGMEIMNQHYVCAIISCIINLRILHILIKNTPC